MRKGISILLALGFILLLSACGNTDNVSAPATEAVTTIAPTTVVPTTVAPSTAAPTTEPATEKSKAPSPIDMLGLSFDEILKRYGNDYTEVDEPGSGLTKCICYPNTGNPYEFGIDAQSQCVKVIYVYDINDDPIVLFDEITNRTKLSEMSDARAKYPNTISNGPLIDNIKQSISFTYRDGVLVNFDWINNDVSDKADRVMIIDTNGIESSSDTQQPVEHKNTNDDKQSSNTQSSSAQEKTEETQSGGYEKYLGSWGNTGEVGRGYTVVISSVNGNQIECSMSLTGSFSHMATVSQISMTIEDDVAHFDYTDSWTNKGNGSITFCDDTIIIEADITERNAKGYSFMTPSPVELTKINDSTNEPFF